MNNPDSPTPPPKPTVARSAPLATPKPMSEVIPEKAPETGPETGPEIGPEDFLKEPTAPEQFMDLDPLISLADLISTLTDYEKQRVDPETGQVFTVEQIKVNMPIELRVEVDESGQVRLKGSAPTQRTETAVLPVFHQMQLRIVEDRHGQ